VPVKVLVVTNMYPTARRPYFGIFVQRQVEALRRAGVPVAVEVVAGDRGEADYFTGRPRVLRAIREHLPDLLHYHYGYTPLVAPLAGVPYIVTLCGDDLNGESDGRGGITLKTRAGRLVTQAFAAGARRVIVKSEAMRRRLWPAARRKAEVLPNGVDTSLFHPLPRADARARLGIRSDALVIAFVNSIGQATKRLDLAEGTRDELARRGAPVQLLVAEQVPPSEMPWYYRAADCLLMTSDLEGSPNCVKEALACGTPVVGVPVGDLPELIASPAMGRVVARDPVALADAVLSLGPRPDPPPSLLPASLSDERVAERLVAIYAAALERDAAPRGAA
jgi:teichuronic acid biosynthesis glycosyltransferase TuaC